MRIGFRARTVLAALCVATLYGLGVYWWSSLAAGRPEKGPAVITLLLLGPAAAASIGVLIIAPREGGHVGQDVLTGCTIVTVLLLVAAVFLREGALCLVMAAPLFYASAGIGAVVTGALVRMSLRRAYSAAFLLIPLAVSPIETRATMPETREAVSNTIDIRATPEQVWQHTIEIRDIRPDELHWTLTQDVLGVPKPEDAQLKGRGVGAVRNLRWGRGVRFQEVVTDWRPGQRVAWGFKLDADALRKVVDEHIRFDRDYLKITGGEYELTALPGGGTRLRLTTHYTMRVAGAPYWAFWGRVFLGDFHRNVLAVIKQRSEGDAQQRARPADASRALHA